jgi:hypothetical protein
MTADIMSQIRQRPGDPVIAPVTVLLGHANDQLLNLCLDSRSARAATGLGAIEFAGDELAVPGQDGVWPGYIGHLGKSLAAQSMTDLAQRGSLSVGELQPPLQLGFEDAIFSGQIFIPRQQLLVHHPSDKGQDARPIHSSSTPADARLIAATNRSQRHRMGLRREWTIHRVFYGFNFLAIRHNQPQMLIADVRFGSKADICNASRHVRFTPESGHLQCTSPCPLWAKTSESHFDYLDSNRKNAGLHCRVICY